MGGTKALYLVCTLSPGKDVASSARQGDDCLLHYAGLHTTARQTLDVLRSGWERGRGGLPGLYVESGKDVARSGGKGDDRLLHHAGLLNPPDKHPVVHVQLVLLQEALARRIPGLHLSQINVFLFKTKIKGVFSDI